MDDKQKNPVDNTRRCPFVIPSNEIIQNPNPKANENLLIRTGEPKKQNTEPTHGVGSEITDGEDA